MSPEGEIMLTFNQDMLVPSDRSTIDYSSILDFTVKAAADNSRIKAEYIASP